MLEGRDGSVCWWSWDKTAAGSLGIADLLADTWQQEVVR
jgi:hypothetical protein